MNFSSIQHVPEAHSLIQKATESANFTMPSDMLTCGLLKTLAATKIGGSFLELGTGTGLSTAWILDGMDNETSLISFDNDPELISIASKFLKDDSRLNLVVADGEDWIMENREKRFDYIFADTWHGKYLLLDETINMLKEGGLYIVDDMIPHENWPEGHKEKAENLVLALERREDVTISKLSWATGIIIASKKKGQNCLSSGLLKTSL
ncbi:MAG: putative O-methyltransferase YrrM [Arcticibacterium sp.]|jgi:predicted O-methyltransferase YrrM